MSRKAVLLFISAILAASLLLNLWLLLKKETASAPRNMDFGWDPGCQGFPTDSANPPCRVDSDCKFWNPKGYCDTKDKTFQDQDIGVCGKKGE